MYIFISVSICLSISTSISTPISTHIHTHTDIYIYIYIYIYIHIYLYLYLYLYLHLHLHIYLYLFLHCGRVKTSIKYFVAYTGIHAHMHHAHRHTDMKNMSTCEHSYLLAYTRVYAHAYIHACSHAVMHPHTHTHTYLGIFPFPKKGKQRRPQVLQNPPLCHAALAVAQRPWPSSTGALCAPGQGLRRRTLPVFCVLGSDLLAFFLFVAK